MTPHPPPLPPEGVLRTNPVYVLQTFGPLVPGGAARLREDFRGMGVAVPAAAPGVVGLVYRRPEGPGFVTPLVARLADDWYVAPNLPFGQADLHDGLARLFQAAGADTAGLLSEVFAFDVRDRAGLSPDGTSMTVAGLLAVLAAAAGGDGPRLRAACAVVEPAEGDALRAVAAETVPAKLGAFVREYGRGSLLVRPARCPAAAPFDGHFEEVWRVDSFADLAGQAERAGLLAAFRRHAPLDRLRFDWARDRLRAQGEIRHRYQWALPRAERLLEHPRQPDVPPASVEAVRVLVQNLRRHLGRYAEAVAAAAAEVRRLAADPHRPSYDEQACAAVGLAAALFDAHRFDEAGAALAGWYERIVADPALVSPSTRVMVLNTLGRTEAIRGGDWEAKFRAALALQRHTNPPDLARTLCYLAYAQLRHGRLREAGQSLREGRACPGANVFSPWVLSFLRADLQRRRGRGTWDDPALDGRDPEPGLAGHPFGMYFQATARQAGRPRHERVERLERAAAFFEVDVAGSKGPCLLSFLAACVRLRAAAEGGSAAAWRALRRDLARHFRGRDNRGLARHYRAAWQALGAKPSAAAAEALLDLVPYF